jgi:hypothetical protein
MNVSQLVRDVDLAGGLLLPLRTLRRVLRDVPVQRRKGDACWYRWKDAGVALDSAAMHESRRKERERIRRRVTGSRYWVDGFPLLVAQWDARNELLPYQVSHGSHAKVWWCCKAGPDHRWRADVANRVRGAGCPFCTNLCVSVTNSLETCHPEIAKQWHPTHNGKLTPRDVIRGTGKRVWWRCTVHRDHEWKGSVHQRTMSGEHGCPFCAGLRASRTNSLATTVPAVAREWAHGLNGKLKPHMVTARANRKVWWRCSRVRSHVWQATVANRVGRGSGCPVCSNHRAPEHASLARHHPAVAKLWDTERNGHRMPERVRPTSRRSAWWRCPRGHHWRQTVRVAVARGACPECRPAARARTRRTASVRPRTCAPQKPDRHGRGEGYADGKPYR